MHTNKLDEVQFNVDAEALLFVADAPDQCACREVHVAAKIADTFPCADL